MHAVTLEELRDLFTGVPAEATDEWCDGWATTPSHTVTLALEIAKRCDAKTEYDLRKILYDTSSPDEIPPSALEAIKLAAQAYRSHLDQQAKPARRPQAWPSRRGL